mmetsp:Transcript_29143/g.41016  ORF Transcript_29143/g.41016 Transcript_29143/m.41016 type:complete len:431 (-) Transcript_29143:488-1780(-)
MRNTNATPVHKALVCLSKPIRLFGSTRIVEVPPVDWQKAGAAKQPHFEHYSNEFRTRKLQEKFNTNYFTQLEKELQNKVSNQANNQILLIEYATILTQFRPTTDRLLQARQIFESVLHTNELPHPVLLHTKEILEDISEMLSVRPQHRSSITRVNWSCYNRCPLACKGCYNVFPVDTLSSAEIGLLLEKLRSVNCEEVILSGGDPFLWKLLPEVVNAFSKYFRIGVDTVGYNLDTNHLELVGKHLSYIGIPLDGATQDQIETFRRGKRDVLQVTLSKLSMLDDYTIPVKINTVVHSKNIGQLDHVATIIQQHRCVTDWYLFQYWPTLATDHLAQQMCVKDSHFLKIATAAAAMVSVPTSIKGIEQRTRNTFFIASNGDVFVPAKSNVLSLFLLGNVIQEPILPMINSIAIKPMSPKFQQNARFYRTSSSS